VIESMNATLDDIKQRHKITGFHLIGFSGGGNVAALLTERRDDVVSLRTVAGNLDHKLQSQIHDVSLMSHSLNAKDIAQNVSHIPQIHYVGEKDNIIHVQIVQSYKKAARSQDCIQIEVVPDMYHTSGWENIWPELILKKPFCTNKD